MTKKMVASYGACEVTSFKEIGAGAGAAVEGCSNINTILVFESMK